MTRPGDRSSGGPDGLEELGDLDVVVDELNRYADLSNESAPHGFADRVMAAVEHEPTPRRWSLGWLAAFATPARHTLRMATLTAVIVLAVGGALVGAQLSGFLRQGPTQTGSSGSPSASSEVTESPTPSPSLTPSPTLVPTPTPSPTPEATESSTQQPEQTSQPSTRSPRPSSSEGGGGETSQPTETPHPSGSAGSGDG